ncbi:tenascin isoform X2 [Triplophysa dalaica]|uniref:tenascin isoform X2 n=1 Tax=Triplophysa dalaica TaxID=1582913 RepID=UPI0024DFF58A|nr:tenascin isoform X2 [Triplophysa dalaica]
MEFLLPFLLLVLPRPALSSQDLHSGTQRTSRDVKPQPIKVIITDTCAQDGAKGREIDLDPDNPLVLTHQIRLVPGSGQGCGQSEVDIVAMRERIERLEKELSDLREKCGSPEGCCKSQQSKGAVCTTERPTTDECPDDCNDQGRCVDGKCVCFPGFSGPDCGIAECPDDCNNFGKCVNGQCVCDPGFSGPDCSTSKCPDNCSDKGRCVNGRCVCNPGFTGPSCQTQSCPENCNNHGRCVKSRCVCDAGFTGPDCSETSCPENCNNRGRCVNGQCVCNPGFTGPDCSIKACPENCSNHGRCVQGKCICESGFTGPDCSSASCPGNCNNHGRCVKSRCVCDEGFTGLDCSETSCPENCNKRGRCVNGQCVCNPGFTGPDCSIKACPENCSNRGRCVQGKCVCETGFTGPDCSSVSCPGNCNNHGRCVKSRCVCDAGFTGTDCSETSCPENCKKRGRCVNGQCVCNTGFTGLDCSVKACPENCSNHGRCVQGKCVCESGFTGADCSSASCPGNCNNHGRCVKSRCVCDAGFTGPDCSETSCPENCNNRGRCVNGQCVCNPGFTGPDCSIKACPENCSNHGRCEQGKCVCESGFTGADCSSASCPGNCNNHGRCVKSRCVCDAGFTGPDCSETSCPENCNNRGRCVNGQCVCNPGFTGPDCSIKACPENCSNHGRCEQGKCVCETGFTGPDCSSASCPGNCNNQGRCVNGRCVCESGFTGQDCSSKACPSNCNDKGRCVNGKCVCDVGFAGQDCSAKTCPNNCSNRGRCMKGKCICRRGFTGSSCSECESGLTGDNCDIALLGVSHLRTREITESSVSLFWTQPAVQYDTYHITFTSMKESNQKISSKISGLSTTYIQTGLAAGQEYTVSLTGEKEGMMGAETTAKFYTLISGPKDLQVVKTTTRSVVVKWEKAQGEIDRYVLSVTPNKTSDRLPEVPRDYLPPERDSAQIDGLEPGNLYDISLVAEKDSIRSLPASVQATPGGSIVGDRAVKGLDESQPTAETSEARRSVKEKAGQKDIEADEEEEIAGVINTSLSSARQAETTRYPILTTTSLPHLPTSPYLTQPKRKNEYELNVLAERPPGKKTLSIPRQPSRAQPLGPASTALEGRPFKSTSSFVETQKEKRPSLPSPVASGVSKEALVEKEQGSQASTPKSVQNSPSESSSLSLRAPIKKSTEKSNEGPDRDGLMPFQRKPFRDSLSRRPFVSTFQNRSRQILSPPQYPSRGSIRRPLIRNNRTISSIQQVKPAIITEKQNSTSIQIRPNTILNRSNGTANRLAANRMSQFKHSGTTQIAPNISEDGRGNADISFSTDHLPENENKPHEYKLNETSDSIEHVRVNNVTSNGFVLKWGAPKGKFEQFIITHTKLGEQNKEEHVEEEESKEPSHVIESGANIKKLTAVLPGSARLFHMINLKPQTRYSLSIFGKGPAIHSKTHNLTVRTGPEPPSNLAFSDVTDSSFTVSWTKPKSKLSGFKITYTHVEEGEPISVSVDSETVNQTLSPLSPGSTYEVRVMSVLGQDESDSIKDTVTTLPDPPTDLRAINITDSKALLLWRPALATIDHYIIMYSSETAPRSGITIKVSGNAAEQQLEALQASSEYRVTLKSQMRDLSSSEATTVFTTSSGTPAGNQADGPQDLKASQVKPRSAVLSWKPPNSAVTSYKLSYYTNGQDIKEVILDPTIKEYKLSRLYPMSKYTALLQVERGGLYMTAISTEFTTGNLRFPFPTDCSQERQNGELQSGMVEVFPQGKQGNPMMVYCDMETDGGGWTVFQRRKNGKTDFYQNWRNYTIGFGKLDEEFWLGNDHLHNFTVMSPTMLRVDLKAGDKSVYAQYSSFSVDSRKNSYAIKISGYSGTAGDSLSYHDGCSFSTWDRDLQAIITRCAMSYRGGWWYRNCHESNLNGVYDTITNHQGVIWTDWKGKDFSIPFTEMKFRPASFKP